MSRKAGVCPQIIEEVSMPHNNIVLAALEMSFVMLQISTRVGEG